MKKHNAAAIFAAITCLFAATRPLPAAGAQPGEALADLALSSVGDAKFILASAGAHAAELQDRANAQGLAVVIVPVGGPGASVEVDCESLASAAAAAGASPGIISALRLGPVAFFVTWLRADPKAASLVRFSGLPTVVDSMVPGFTALPDGLLFKPVPDESLTPDVLRGAAERFGSVRDELGEILLSIPRSDDADNGGLAAFWRQNAAQAGNNLGCLLAVAGLDEDAVSAFRAADSVNPDAISPLLNLATLAKKGVGAASREDLAKRLGAVAGPAGGGASLACNGGYVLQPEDFFPARWFWAATGLRDISQARLEPLVEAAEKHGGEAAKRAVVQMLLAETALRSVFSARLVEAFSKLGVAEAGGWQPKTAIAAAYLLFDINERVRAMQLLDAVSAELAAKADAKDEDGSFALSLARIDLLGRSGRAKELAGFRGLFAALPSGNILAAANLALAAASAEADDWAGAAASWKTAAQAVDSDGTPIAPWALDASKGAAAIVAHDPAAAKEYFVASLETGASNQWSVLSGILVADFGLGDKRDAKDRARELIALRPRHAFANFVLANISAEEGRLDEAIFRYQTSLAERFSWMAANDFASMLSKGGDLKMAERMARDALAAGGEPYAAAHDTLGEALAAQGRWSEALAAFRKATTLPGGDSAEILLHLAEALVASGSNAEAAQLIPAIDAGKASFSIRDRERLGALRRAVSEK